ncbi:MAG: hypothetical protein ACI9KN_001042 [Gammaproteobacteria bacterium]|jgi:hypothetical protein
MNRETNNFPSDLPTAESMLESVARSDLKSTAQQFAEMGIDSLLDSSVLREIPIVGSVVALTSATIAIRDRLFLKKVLKFIAQIYCGTR